METMCEDLKTVAAWFCSNSLHINPDKTKLLVFGTRQMLCNVSSNFKLSLLGKELSPVPFAKDLGVFMHLNIYVTNSFYDQRSTHEIHVIRINW